MFQFRVHQSHCLLLNMSLQGLQVIIFVVYFFCMVLVIYSFGTSKIVSVPSTIFRTKSFKTVEASLRVDALASAGFKISRSKLVDLIRYTLFPLIVDVHFCLAVALCRGKAYAVTAYLDRDTVS